MATVGTLARKSIFAAFSESTRSAFRPAATPVALVANGRAPGLFVSMKPASSPSVSNSNARPFFRLLARMQGSRPALERQP